MFWEPHSSSIDFCETNYLHSNYVVEIHNTWSSLLGLSCFGILGLLLNNHTHEMRHTAAYAILVLIGFGSAGLHGTLHWFLQSADELPMMYLLMSLIYLCAEVDSPQFKCHYPNLPRNLSLIAVANTLLYYCLQKIYIVFLFTFASETILVGVWLHRIMYGTQGQEKRRSAVARRICNTGILSIILAAVPCWLYDMLQCRSFVDLSNEYFQGMTPHVLWHFGAGFGAYCVIVSLECSRLEELEIPYKVSFLQGGGIFPIITVAAEV